MRLGYLLLPLPPVTGGKQRDQKAGDQNPSLLTPHCLELPFGEKKAVSPPKHFTEKEQAVPLNKGMQSHESSVS